MQLVPREGECHREPGFRGTLVSRVLGRTSVGFRGQSAPLASLGPSLPLWHWLLRSHRGTGKARRDPTHNTLPQRTRRLGPETRQAAAWPGAPTSDKGGTARTQPKQPMHASKAASAVGGRWALNPKHAATAAAGGRWALNPKHAAIAAAGGRWALNPKHAATAAVRAAGP